MEEDLDKIAEATKKWVPIISEFYKPFAENLKKKEKELSKKELTEEATEKKCPECGKPMVIKLGRFGRFYACSGFPECKHTEPLEEEKKEIEEIEKESKEKCEKCGADMVVKRGRYGAFLACSRYPECKFTKPIVKSTGAKCPECKKGEIVERKSKKGRIFYSCNRYPDCKFAIWQKPTGENCPKCGDLLVYAGKDKVKCSSKECDYVK
jgi:DNA topoisomerase-1